MSFTFVTLTGKLLSPDSTPASGAQLTFVLSAPLSDGSSTMIDPVPHTATVGSDGAWSLVLAATDDPTTIPVGQTYQASYSGQSADGQPAFFAPWSFILPHANATVDLSTLQPAVPAAASVPVSFKHNVVTRTLAYAAGSLDFVLADASGGGFTVSLPLPVSSAGMHISVKKVDNTANAVTVVPLAGTVDGAASCVLRAQYASRDFVCDGFNWFLA